MQHGLLAPIPIFFVRVLGHARAPLAEPHGFHTEIMPRGASVLADTLQPQRVVPRLGPEIEQMPLPGRDAFGVEVELADRVSRR